ncbi:MAG: SDR family oxidoreductase [Balneolales bacterium]|nr:SDR family oxidoreductase [Balneolales bacterium]
MSDQRIKTVSVLGCGWFGLPLAARLVRSGFWVNGSTTTPEKREKMKATGINDYLIRLSPGVRGEQDIHSFFDTDSVIINIPPGRNRGSAASAYRLMIDNLLPYLKSSPASQVIFISSTSVYPDLNRVVYEQDAGCGQISESGQIMLDSENKLRDCQEFSTTILRFGGLYGDERHPAKYLAGRTGLPNPDAPVNLVHLEDCIRITERILRMNLGDEVFNVVCDEHPNRKTYYTESTRRLGLEKPQFVNDEDNTASVSWKQVSNRNLKEKTGYQFKFKSPYEGY